MVVIIISSILRSISDNLENKGISQITYYITYILIVSIIMKNFFEMDAICPHCLVKFKYYVEYRT